MAQITTAPTDVPVNHVPLSAEQRQWLTQAVALVDEERMRTFDRTITGIHSPTGEERAINEWIVQHMRAIGLEAVYQPVDAQSGNAVGRLRGTGSGPCLMLYAPIDTHLRADPAGDVPWVGPELRPDMLPHAAMADNGDVIGLGAAGGGCGERTLKAQLFTQLSITHSSPSIAAVVCRGSMATCVIRTWAMFSTRRVPWGVSIVSPTWAVRRRCFMI